VSRRPTTPAAGAPWTGDRASRLAARLLWPVAVCAVLQLGLHAATGPARDLAILWSAGSRLRTGGDLYDAGLAFIYPPLAGWVLAPLAALPFRAAVVVVTAVSLAALVAATVLALRLVGVPWRSPVTAGVLLLLVLSRPVVGLLEQGNVDLLLLLVEVLVVHALLVRRDLLAGVLLGVALAVKPTLAPMLLAAVVLGRWGVAARAAVVAAVLSVVGVLTVPDGWAFVTDVVPLLGDGNREVLRQYDRSLRGAAEQLGAPDLLGTVLRVAVLAVAVAVAWARRRTALAAAEVVPVLLLGGLLASSFSWANHSVYLLPLLVTVARPGSLVRAWPAWVGAYLVWSAQPWPAPGDGVVDALVGLRPTWGWLLLLGACAVLARRDRAAAGGAAGSGAQPLAVPGSPAAAEEPGVGLPGVDRPDLRQGGDREGPQPPDPQVQELPDRRRRRPRAA
jgi:arabinofuranan 3-O-arabinosyltransferase